MRHVRKVIALVLAAFMALAIAAPAWAAALPEGTEGDDKTITITTPAGIDADATNTYTVYKVFDAVPGANDKISYKLLSGQTTAPAGFIVDDGGNVYLGTTSTAATGADGEITISVGNVTTYLVHQTSELTDDQIAAIAAYAGKSEVGTVDIKGPSATKTVSVPDFGYYYVTTSTGTAVNIDSTNKSASIVDKNVVPPVKKEITAANSISANDMDEAGKLALAELGKKVEYTATITVEKGSKNYVFHDKMGSGLAFTGNDEVVVTAGPEVSTADWYTIKTTPDTGDTLTITFVDGIAEDTEITIKYYGVVTSDALTVDTGKNTCYVSYGDENSNNKTPEDETNVYNVKLDVTKTDGDDEPLSGAGFVVMNSENKYYKFTAAAGDTPATVTWYALADGETLETAIAAGKITEMVTTTGDGGNIVSFTGLANGDYTLIESTVPSGYNKAADIEFTINAADKTLTEATAGEAGSSFNVAKTVINNSGSVLPSTGGMGTTILYIVGGIMLVGGAVVLISKRRVAGLEK